MQSPPRIAKRRTTKVTRSPHQWTIEQKLLGGVAVEEVSIWLKEEAIPPENISGRALRRHLKRIAPTRALKQTYYSRMHHNLDVKVNALQELYNAVYVLKVRVSVGLEKEQVEGKADAKTRADMGLLINTLIQILKFELQLGIRDSKSPEGDASMLADIEKFRKQKAKAQVIEPIDQVIDPNQEEKEQEKERTVEVTGSSASTQAE